jgi:hypothetical protein
LSGGRGYGQRLSPGWIVVDVHVASLIGAVRGLDLLGDARAGRLCLAGLGKRHALLAIERPAARIERMALVEILAN